MITTVAELKDRFRRDVDDREEGPDPTQPDADSLWSNDDIVWYANSAIDRVLRDTAAETRTFILPVTAGSREVRLPQNLRILDIRAFKLASNGRDLDPVNVDSRVGTNPTYFERWSREIEWDNANQTGVPQRYTRDRRTGRLYLDPVPASADSVYVTATVTTVTAQVYFDLGDSLPFDELVDIHLLLMWMKKLAYEKQDADAMDLSRAESFEAQYATAASTRRWERYRQRRPVQQVRFSW